MWLSASDKVTSNFEESQGPYRPVFDKGKKDNCGYPYRKQRSVLEIEFSEFLESTSKRDICSAIPDDGIDFLIWNDNFGKTVVHIDTCPLFGEKSVVRSSAELLVLARGQAFS